MPDQSSATPRDFLAVERTFLAWIRTGLALMGFGFVLARFGIFLREFSIHQPGFQDQSFGLSVWFGTGLILIGVLAVLFSLVRYRRVLRNVAEAQHLLAEPSTLAVSVAAILVLVGLAMAVYLISIRPAAADKASKPREISMNIQTDSGIARLASQHSVDETVSKLESILQAKGVKLFNVVDHSGEAAAAGMKMPNTKLLIFGNPKAGTPLMLASPSAALDLPLKILVAEDSAGNVWVSYNAPAYLQSRHNLPTDLLPNITVIETLAAKAAE